MDSRDMLLLPHSPSPFFSPCRYYCMPVRALKTDTGLPLSKSSPSLTGPNSLRVNPSRAGGTSAGSAPHAPHRGVQAPHLEILPCHQFCARTCLPHHCRAANLLPLSTGILLPGPLLTIHVCHRVVRVPWAVPLRPHVPQQGGGELLLPFPFTETAVLENKALAALNQ